VTRPGFCGKLRDSMSVKPPLSGITAQDGSSRGGWLA
jgi:hypothetical protein